MATNDICVRHLQNALRKVERELGHGIKVFYSVGADGELLVCSAPGMPSLPIPGVRLAGLDHLSKPIRDLIESAQGGAWISQVCANAHNESVLRAEIDELRALIVEAKALDPTRVRH